MLTPKSEMKIIRKLGHKPTIKKALHAINVANGVLINRRGKQTGLNMQHELFESQAYTIKRKYGDLL